ncbi:MAG: phosphatase PAP2 family protein [Gemmatimonadaceae bacterium]
MTSSLIALSSTRRWIIYAVAAIACVAASALLDQWVYDHVARPDVYEHDWGRMLRMVGYLPTWIAVAVGAACADPTVRDWRGTARSAPALVLYSATAGGIAAELLKLVIRRRRPDAAHGVHLFRAWSDHPLSNGGFGMPSSHALVAFGAAVMLARVYPRGRILWYALAAGCAATRVLSRAHFLSDVVLAAAVAPMIGHWVANGLGAKGVGTVRAASR